jgi:hypothetical protein
MLVDVGDDRGRFEEAGEGRAQTVLLVCELRQDEVHVLAEAIVPGHIEWLHTLVQREVTRRDVELDSQQLAVHAVAPSVEVGELWNLVAHHPIRRVHAHDVTPGIVARTCHESRIANASDTTPA